MIGLRTGRRSQGGDMKSATIVLLSAALLLLGVWAGHGTASARETDWAVEQDPGPSADAPHDAADEFEAAIPAETGSLPSGDATGFRGEEGPGPSFDRFVDPKD